MADVLLVDDNGSVLLTLAIALRRRGHAVTMSSEGTQALAYLRQHRFDFLISDVRMPGMSGIQLAACVKQLPNPPHIILTSAYSTLEAREGLAEAFLRKPIDIAQLDTILSQLAHEKSHQHSSHEPQHAERVRQWG
jgi:CheY-like chemotaxis protein